MHKHGKKNQAFKLVWSEARGRYMAVPEIAKGRGKSSCSVGGAVRDALLACSGVLLLGYGAGVWATEPSKSAVPAAGAGNTTAYIAPNGVSVVNINTANGSGVSNNVYTKFNVESNGLVLNNWSPDRGNTGQSQLAGALVFNPNLDKEAKVILNQVNSTNPSVLKGFMEVHGGTADVVVANPNGIACDGCGVINTNRFTLTTGTPYLDAQGALGGFDVTQGSISVGRGGMDASRAAQVDLVARSIVLDGGVSGASEGSLQVIAGANRWRYTDGVIEAKLTPAAGDAPAYAVDSTVFGGLAAGKIRITASQAGIGVRMDGKSAAGKDGFVINADGRIEVLGSISAEKDVKLNSNVHGISVGAQGQVLSNASVNVDGSSLSNAGHIGAQGDVGIRVDETVSNRGRVEAGQSLQLVSSQVVNDAEGHLGATTGLLDLKAAGIQNAGILGGKGQQLQLQSDTLQNTGTIEGTSAQLVATQALINNGTLVMEGALDVTAQGISNQAEGKIQAGLAQLAAQQSLINDGTVLVEGALNATAQGIANQAGGKIHAGSAQLASQQALINAGEVMIEGPLNITAQTITNLPEGKIRSGTQAQLTATNGNIENQGSIYAKDSLGLTAAAGVVRNRSTGVALQGLISSAGDLKVDAKGLTNTGDVLGDGDVHIAVDQVDNIGSIEAGDSLRLVAQKILNRPPGNVPDEPNYFVRGGYIGARTGLAYVQANDIDNGGTIGSTTQRVQLQSDRLTNTGTIVGADVAVNATQWLDNNGALIGLGPLKVTAGWIANKDDGGIYSRTVGQLTATTGGVTNRGSIFAEDSLLLTAMAGKVDNQSTVEAPLGFIGSNGNLAIKAKAFENRSEVSATGDIHISADTFLNSVQTDTTRVRDSTYAQAQTQQDGPTQDYYSFPDRYKKTYYFKDWTETERLVGGIPIHKPQIISGGNLTIDNFVDAKNNGGVLSAAKNVYTNGKTGSGATFVNDDLTLRTFYMRESWMHYVRYAALGGAKHADELRDFRTYTTKVTDDKSIGAGIFAGNTFNASGTHIQNSGAQYHSDPTAPVVDNRTKTPDLTPFLPISTNGRFVLAAQVPGAKYLVETNQFYLRVDGLLGSDYLAEALGLNLDTLVMRLGDPNYEAYLVRQQLIAKTGRFFQGDLDAAGNQLSENLQMQKMWTAAADAKKQLNLTWGTALSPEQVSKLTQNITWMVMENVNGQDVLVPRVYLAPKTADQITNGAVIEARHVNMDGVLSVSNLGGVIKGEKITIKSEGDVRNMSGLIDGGTVDITSTKGKVINETVQTFGNGANVEAVAFETGIGETETHNLYKDGEFYTTTGRTAGIRATNKDGQLNITADKGILIKGAALASAGDASLTTTGAEGDIRFEAIQDIEARVKHESLGGDGGMQGGYRNTTTTTVTHTGSSADIAGKLKINSARDVAVVGSQITANDLDAQAAGKFEVLSVHDSVTKSVDAQSTSMMQGSLFSQTETKERYYSSNVVGSNIQIANKANISADSIKVLGSTVDGDKGGLWSFNKLEVLEDHNKNYMFKEEKRFDAVALGGGGKADAKATTNLMGDTTTYRRTADGSVDAQDTKRIANFAGFTSFAMDPKYSETKSKIILPADMAQLGLSGKASIEGEGNAYLAKTQVTTAYRAEKTGVSSTVKSANGKLELVGRGKDSLVTVVGSDVTAESLSVKAHDVQVLAGEDTSYTRTQSTTVGIGAFSNAKAGIEGDARWEAKGLTPSTSAQGTAGASASGVITFGAQVRERSYLKQDVNVRGASLTATGTQRGAGDVDIVATGDVLFKGATVEAKNDINIDAKNIINEVAESTSFEMSSSRVQTHGLYIDGLASANGRVAADAGAVTPHAVGIVQGSVRADVSAGVRSAVSEVSESTMGIVNKASTFKAGGSLNRNATNNIYDAATNFDLGGDLNQSATNILERAVHDSVTTSSYAMDTDTRIGVYATANAFARFQGHAGVGALGGEPRENQGNLPMLGVNGRAYAKAYSSAGVKFSTQTERSWSDTWSQRAVVSGYKVGGTINSVSKNDTKLVGSIFKVGKDVNFTSTDGSVTYAAAKDIQSASARRQEGGASGTLLVSVTGMLSATGNVGMDFVDGRHSAVNAVVGDVAAGGRVHVSGKKGVTLEGVKLNAAKDVSIDSSDGAVNLSAAENTRNGIAWQLNMDASLTVTGAGLNDIEELVGTGSMGVYAQSLDVRAQRGGEIKAGGDVNIRSRHSQTLVGTRIDANHISLVSERGSVNLLDARYDEHIVEGGFQLGVAAEAIPSNEGDGSIKTTSAGSLEIGGKGFTTGAATTLIAKNIAVSAAKDIVNHEARISQPDYVVRGNEVKSDIYTQGGPHLTVNIGGHMNTVTEGVPGLGRESEKSYYEVFRKGDKIYNRMENKTIERVAFPTLPGWQAMQGARSWR